MKRIEWSLHFSNSKIIVLYISMYDDKWIITTTNRNENWSTHSISNTFNLSDYHWVTKRKPYKLYVKVKAHRHTPCDHLFCCVSVSLYRPLYAPYIHATSSKWNKKKKIRISGRKNARITYVSIGVLYIHNNNTLIHLFNTFSYTQIHIVYTQRQPVDVCSLVHRRVRSSDYCLRVCTYLRLLVYIRLLILKEQSE